MIMERKVFEMTAIEIITQLGFPIAAAIGVAAYVVELNKQHRDDIKELTKSNGEKMDKMTEAINNNTLVMTRIYERLGVDNGKENS